MQGLAPATTMPNRPIALLIEYDGTRFVGMQRQAEGVSIEGELERVAAILGAPEARVKSSGRTDSGVHARGQVAVLPLPESLPVERVVSALNWHLPDTIRIRRAALATDTFDPRRDAIRRTYRYLLCAGQPLPPLMLHRMGKCRSRLDIGAMLDAATALLGDHDFAAWRSSQCQARRTVLTLQTADVRPWADAAPHGLDGQCFEFTFQCRSFLHRMVRFLVGGLIEAGRGRLTRQQLESHLAAKTLPPGVAPADACGLSLERVDYAEGKDPFQDL